MRLRKSILVILLLSFGLTGCYTQLEYSQKMKRVTSEKSDTGYAWSDEDEEKANLTEADSIYIAETYGAKVAPYREGEQEAVYEDEDYIPIPYKDYDVVETYEACDCDPYKEYVIYNNYYPSSWGYSSFYSPHHYYGSSFYAFGAHYDYWRYIHGYDHFRRGFGLGFYLTFYGGSYYSPFFYDPFYYGYYPGYYYNPYHYSNFYYGGGYAGYINDRRSDRRYGPRSIGADRVRNGNTAIRNRSDITRSRKDGNTVRTRTTGVQRTRGTVQRSGSTTTRNRGTIGNSSRTRSNNGTRSRGAVKRSGGNDNGKGVSRSRSGSSINRDHHDNRQRSRVTNLGVNRNKSLMSAPVRIDRAEMESRIRKQRIKSLNDPQTKRSFFGRFKSVFDNGSIYSRSRYNSGTNRSFKSSSRSRSKIGNTSRSSRSSSGSSVTRSRSSSKSSGSRSRGSSGGSSSKRDRGNN
ncbi:MAG TPA: hypothetical protein VJ905_01775 [Halalkalibaculum sp.]|nr:hypothetical protein [Halalkalibaculum sp.]